MIIFEEKIDRGTQNLQFWNFRSFHHCISLVTGAPKPSDLDENLKNHEIQSFFATGFNRFRAANSVSVPSTIDDTYEKN